MIMIDIYRREIYCKNMQVTDYCREGINIGYPEKLSQKTDFVRSKLASDWILWRIRLKRRFTAAMKGAYGHGDLKLFE